MKSKIILSLLFINFLIHSVELPHPKNDCLYTEFDSYRYAKFLKKPIAGTGYIVMDGKDRFVFIQTKPLHVEIRKNGDRVMYKKGNGMAVDVSNMAMDMFFLFEEQDTLNANYDISKNAISDKDEYIVTPKDIINQNLKYIRIIGKLDVFESVELFFNDESKILYIFKNTITGSKPDEKYF